MSTKRTILAFMVAPFAVPIVFFIPIGELPKSFQVANILSGYFVYGIYAIPMAYVAECVLGLPFWWILMRYRVRSLPVFLAVGAVIGFGIYWGTNVLARSFPSAGNAASFWTNPYLFLCVAGGAAATLVFWSIAIAGGNRDRIS